MRYGVLVSLFVLGIMLPEAGSGQSLQPVFPPQPVRASATVTSSGSRTGNGSLDSDHFQWLDYDLQNRLCRVRNYSLSLPSYAPPNVDSILYDARGNVRAVYYIQRLPSASVKTDSFAYNPANQMVCRYQWRKIGASARSLLLKDSMIYTSTSTTWPTRRIRQEGTSATLFVDSIRSLPQADVKAIYGYNDNQIYPELTAYQRVSQNGAVSYREYLVDSGQVKIKHHESFVNGSYERGRQDFYVRYHFNVEGNIDTVTTVNNDAPPNNSTVHIKMSTYDRQYNAQNEILYEFKNAVSAQGPIAIPNTLSFWKLDTALVTARKPTISPRMAIFENQGNLFVRTTGPVSDAQISVVSMAGSCVLMAVFSGSEARVDVSALPPGIYAIHLFDGAQFYSRRFYKQ